MQPRAPGDRPKNRRAEDRVRVVQAVFDACLRPPAEVDVLYCLPSRPALPPPR